MRYFACNFNVGVVLLTCVWFVNLFFVWVCWLNLFLVFIGLLLLGLLFIAVCFYGVVFWCWWMLIGYADLVLLFAVFLLCVCRIRFLLVHILLTVVMVGFCGVLVCCLRCAFVWMPIATVFWIVCFSEIVFIYLVVLLFVDLFCFCWVCLILFCFAFIVCSVLWLFWVVFTAGLDRLLVYYLL